MLRLRFDVEVIRKEIETGINKFPNHPSFYFYLANLFYDIRDYINAYVYYLKTIQMQQDYKDIEINSVPSNLAHVYKYLAIISEYKNNYKDAMGYYTCSLEFEKYDKDCLIRLSNIMYHINLSHEDALIIINKLYNINSKEDLNYIINNLKKLTYQKMFLPTI